MAMTRARHGLIIVTDTSLIGKADNWKELIDASEIPVKNGLDEALNYIQEKSEEVNEEDDDFM